MAEKSGVGSDGVSGLPFASGGKNLMFAWDVGADLPNVEDSAVYVRLQSNDFVTASNLAASAAFAVDTAGPVIANLSATQNSGADNISIGYDLADGAGSNIAVALSISDDSGATYAVAAMNKSGDVGSAVTAGLNRNIIWNAGADFPDQEKNTMRAKLIAADSFGNQGSFAESADFFADTKAPAVSAVTATQSAGSALVAVSYDLADLSPSDIKFYISSDSGASWDVATTTYTGDAGPGMTAGAKSFNWNAATDFPDQESDTMRVRLRAIDAYGHQSAYEPSADFSVNTKVLSISNIAAVQTLGSKTVAIRYDLNKTATINAEISADGGASWLVATSTLAGQIGAGIAAGYNKAITWNPAIDFNNQEKSAMRVRLRGIDIGGTASSYYESGDFSLDTAAPLGLLSLTKTASADNSVTLDWPAGISNANFKYYELWHGASQSDVASRGGSAAKWGVADDANLSNIAAASTTITGLNLTGDYFVKIWAIDNYGNEASADSINVYSAPVLPPPPAVSIGGGGGYVLPPADTAPPDKPIVLSPKDNETISDANPTLIGAAEPQAIVEITIDNSLTQRVAADADGAWRFTVPASLALADGLHVFAIRQIDASGNAGPSLDFNLTKITAAIPAAAAGQPAVAVSIATQPAAAPQTPPVQLITAAVSAVELPGIPAPAVAAVSSQPAVSGDIMTFSGTALPNSDVVVYIHSDQALIYRAHADSNGLWTVNHSQAAAELAPGQHTIYAVTVDTAAGVKSRPSPISSFTVNRNFWVMMLEYLNLRTTAIALLVLSLAWLWLYRVRQVRETAA